MKLAPKWGLSTSATNPPAKLVNHIRMQTEPRGGYIAHSLDPTALADGPYSLGQINDKFAIGIHRFNDVLGITC